jgi:hypothetical protein
MADAAVILSVVRQELVNAGLVRPPSVAGALPPAHIEPVGGARAPGEGEPPTADPDLVVSLFYSGDIAPATYTDGRTGVVDVRYRSRDNPALIRAYALDAAVRARLVDRIGLAEGRYGVGYFLGEGAPGRPAGLFARQVSVFGGLSRLSASPAAGFDHVAKYAVEVDA